MKIKTTLCTLLLSTPLFVASALAQAPSSAPNEPMPSVESSALTKENSVNLSPLGILSGSYGLNYERVFKGYHGLLVEGNFGSSSSGDASSSSLGGTIGYRFHWRGKQDSGFLGLNLGYYAGSGEASISNGDGTMTKTFDVDTTVSSITANIGRRWAWDSGLNITFRIGAGQGNYDVSTESTDPDAQDAVKLVDDLLAFLPVAFDGELSVGYIF